MRILADQALPRLWKKYFRKELRATYADKDVVLSGLLERGASWWEVFDASDIGAERNLIVDRFVTQGSAVLDVGCGRGFFTFACTRRAGRVTSLDLMDGGGRRGWWSEFATTSGLLEVSGRVSGIRGGANSMPFSKARFDLVASVHSIRNFGSVEEIKSFFREAKRVLRKGGRLMVVESDIKAVGFQVYRSFYTMRTRLGWELTLPPVSGLIKWLESAGFADISEQSLATDLEYAPVYFPFDASSMAAIKADYDAASELRRMDGERHPPITILTAS